MKPISQGKNPEDPLRICECLVKKLDSLRNFFSATVSINKTFASGEAANIDGLIQEREKYMELIDRIDAYIRKIREDKPAYLSSLPDKTRTLIKDLYRRIERILGEISAVDKECNAVAVTRTGIMQRELLKMTQDRHGLQGYRGAISRTPRFLDVKL